MRALGYKRGQADPRDVDAGERLKAISVPHAASVKASASILDQGQRGTCVAHGTAQAVRIDMLRQGVVSPPWLSRLLVYWLARGYEKTTGKDDGCLVRDAFRGLAHYGFCPESAWPYSDDDRYLQMPPWEAFREAIDQKEKGGAANYHRILATGAARSLQVKQAIAAGHAVVFGTDVSEYFCEGKLDPVAEPIPAGKQIAGGHCMCVIGYSGDVFEIANSWGTSFGDGGFFKMSAAYLEWSMTDDLWLVDAAPLYLGGAS